MAYLAIAVAVIFAGCVAWKAADLLRPRYRFAAVVAALLVAGAGPFLAEAAVSYAFGSEHTLMTVLAYVNERLMFAARMGYAVATIFIWYGLEELLGA